jgi:citronellol/citronellal dehydrogenase
MGALKGKTLFITGASRGIGLAIALRAAADGANIAVIAKTDLPHPKLPDTIHDAAAAIDLQTDLFLGDRAASILLKAVQ